MTARRRGLIGAAVGALAAGAGAVLIADRRVTAHRRTGIETIGEYASPTPDRYGFVPADDGVALYYEEIGPPAAPVTVVLVHGFCLDHRAFVMQQRALVERFGDQVRVVAYDQRSHGRSGHSDAARATIDQLGSDLADVLASAAPHGPLVLVGHSMGGMTVMALADRHPELFGAGGRVAGVLLADTSTGKLAAVTLGLPAGVARVGGPMLPVLLGGARHGGGVVERGRARLTDVAWVFVKRLAFGPDVAPGLVEFVTDLIGQTAVDVIADFFPALMSHDKLAALEHLDGTPLVLVCGADDLLTPPEHSQAVADAVPAAKLVVVDGTGHMALLERPEAVDEPLAELVAAALPALRARSRRRRPATLPTAEDMRAFGVRVAPLLRRGDLVVLTGPLGAGKTVLAQGIGAGLAVQGHIASPTFVIARVHPPGQPGGRTLVHVDAYRLGSLDEVDDLDLDVDVASSVTVVEWGAGLVEQLSDARLEIVLGRFRESEVRTATVNPHGGDWAERIGVLE